MFSASTLALHKDGGVQNSKTVGHMDSDICVCSLAVLVNKGTQDTCRKDMFKP